MSYKFTGAILYIGETVQVSESFKKRDLVVSDMAEEYEQTISFQFVQDKCDMLDKYGEGQKVEVSFNLRGREWTSPQGEVKYFNTLDAWRIEPIGEGSQEEEPQQEEAASDSGEEEDLPF